MPKQNAVFDNTCACITKHGGAMIGCSGVFSGSTSQNMWHYLLSFSGWLFGLLTCWLIWPHISNPPSVSLSKYGDHQCLAAFQFCFKIWYLSVSEMFVCSCAYRPMIQSKWLLQLSPSFWHSLSLTLSLTDCLASELQSSLCLWPFPVLTYRCQSFLFW